MAASYVVNLSINAGASFTQLFHLEGDGNAALDLTDYEINSQLRKHPQSGSYINFIATTNGSPSDGVIKLELSPESTLDLKPGRYVYDIEFDNETWIDHEGKKQVPSKKHWFSFAQKDLKRIKV